MDDVAPNIPAPPKLSGTSGTSMMPEPESDTARINMVAPRALFSPRPPDGTTTWARCPFLGPQDRPGSRSPISRDIGHRRFRPCRNHSGRGRPRRELPADLRPEDEHCLLRRNNQSTLLDLCMSSVRRRHANLLCVVPILSDDLRRVSALQSEERRAMRLLRYPPRAWTTLPVSHDSNYFGSH